MGSKSIVVFICSYVVAVGINLLPSLFYPDSSISPWMIGFSALFLILLSVTINRLPRFSKVNFALLVLFFIASAGGLFVYLMHVLGWTWSDSVVLNIVSNGQFFFYIIFIVPLFGLNYFIDLPYHLFSLVVGLFYFAVALGIVLHKKILLQKIASKEDTIQ